MLFGGRLRSMNTEQTVIVHANERFSAKDVPQQPLLPEAVAVHTEDGDGVRPEMRVQDAEVQIFQVEFGELKVGGGRLS